MASLAAEDGDVDDMMASVARLVEASERLFWRRGVNCCGAVEMIYLMYNKLVRGLIIEIGWQPSSSNQLFPGQTFTFTLI